MSKMMSLGKGISPILATLLPIVIAVATVIFTYALVITFTRSQTQKGGAVLVREDVRFYTMKKRTDITIRNTSTADGKTAPIYWSNESYIVILNRLPFYNTFT